MVVVTGQAPFGEATTSVSVIGRDDNSVTERTAGSMRGRSEESSGAHEGDIFIVGDRELGRGGSSIEPRGTCRGISVEESRALIHIASIISNKQLVSFDG